MHTYSQRFALEAARTECVCLSVSVGQDTRTNTPMMSIMQCPPNFISGIANEALRTIIHTISLFINLQNSIKTTSHSLLSGLIQQHPAAILRFARSLHNASAPLVRADFNGLCKVSEGCARRLYCEYTVQSVPAIIGDLDHVDHVDQIMPSKK